MPAVSIIVPVYKVADPLPRCIDSILAQTFRDFELILIDDGSPDNSGAICDQYQARDPRIHVVHKENGGVSAARNTGLDIATGKYACFIDSDDWVEEKYLESFFLNDIQPGCLVIQDIMNDGGGRSYRKFGLEAGYFATPGELSDIFARLKMTTMGYPFSKLYDLDLIRKHSLRFNEKVRLTEDQIFFLTYLLYVDSIRLVPCAYYHYTHDNPGSLTRSYHSFESEREGFECVLKALQELDRKFPVLGPQCDEALGHSFFRIIRSLYTTGHKSATNLSQRLRLLKELSTPQNNRYLKTSDKSTDSLFRNRIPVFFYTRRMFLCYDLYTKGFFAIRDHRNALKKMRLPK